MFRLVVHGSHLMQFARAIGDTDPAFVDVGRLSASGSDSLVAPPTFLMAADHFDPDYPRRPQPGVPWIGAGPRDRDQPSGFHLEQHFTFRRPVRAGDVLTADTRPGACWEKSGRRAGTMRFTESLTDYRDQAGDLVATARWVSAMVERKPEGPAQSRAGDDARPSSSGPPENESVANQAVENGAVENGAGPSRPGLGSSWRTLLVEDLTRTQLVMYAGASGDFHPLHSDDVYARDRGYPGVFAHGMLTMGMTGRAVTDRFGHANVLAFGGRIASQVWPGDTLVADARVVKLRSGVNGCDVAELVVTTRNQHGEVVFDGSAEVRLSETSG